MFVCLAVRGDGCILGKFFTTEQQPQPNFGGKSTVFCSSRYFIISLYNFSFSMNSLFSHLNMEFEYVLVHIIDFQICWKVQ